MKQLKLMMMTLMMCFLITCVNAQTYDNKWPLNDNGEIEYSEVVNVDSNITANALFSNAKMYLANSFKSFKDVVQNVDESSKSILIKGNFGFSCRAGSGMQSIYEVKNHTNFTLLIQCKNGKYRYSLKPDKHSATMWYGNSPCTGDNNTSYGYLLNTTPTCGSNFGFRTLPPKLWNEIIKPKIESEIKSFINDLKIDMIKSTTEDNW